METSDRNKVTKIIGPPGTGKTHYLLGLVEKYLAEGIDPTDIAFISFTNKAVDEAVERACAKFKYKKNDIPYFRTLHSLAFQIIGGDTARVLDAYALNDFGSLAGYSFHGTFSSTGFYIGQTLDDKVLSAYIAGKERGTPIAAIYDEAQLNIDKFYFLDLVHRYEVFKKKNNYIDFNDMITNACESKVFPYFKVLILDEAQDFSPIQWQFVSKLIGNSDKIFLAGDDEQCIFTFRSADVDSFINLPAETVKLEQSYRVPELLQKIAYNYAERFIQKRIPRSWKPRNAKGAAFVVKDILDVDFTKYPSYLILARNQHYLVECMAILTGEGIPATLNGVPNYSDAFKKKVQEINKTKDKRPVFDNDADWLFYTKATAQGFDILNPNIQLSTIHGAKGGEADCVVLLTVMSKASFLEKVTDPDSYYRLLYVALTRAKDTLYIVDTTKDNKYDFT